MSNTLAQLNATTLPTYFPPARSFTTIGGMVNLLVSVLVFGAGIIFLVMLFYAGFIVLTGGGDPEKMTEARNIATYAVVGLVLILTSYLIVRVIGYIFQVDLFI